MTLFVTPLICKVKMRPNFDDLYAEWKLAVESRTKECSL